ncbi:MAG: DUF4372 domain-containing protein [Mangrovibacterium sp.]
MGKNTEIKFVGQPIFKQVINLLEGINLTGLAKKHNTDYYYKAFKAKTHLITVLFGIFSRCDSMTEIYEGLRAMSGNDPLIDNKIESNKNGTNSSVLNLSRKVTPARLEPATF